MKTKIFFFSFFTMILTSVFSQNIQDISAVPSINKGVLITKDGKRIDFRDLHVANDTIILTANNLSTRKIPGQDVYKIAKTGNYVVLSAITCGFAGAIGAYTGTLDWDKNTELKSKKGSYILTSTIGCVLLGGIIGAFVHRDITIYKSASSMSFAPDISFDNYNRLYASLGVKINL